MVERDGGAALSGNTDSGSGGGGYPAAGIGRWWSWSVGGGDHACSAGGYTGGFGENGIKGSLNGLGSIRGPFNSYAIGPGGGYYSYDSTVQPDGSIFDGWFGLGGCWSGWPSFRDQKLALSWSTAGSGGIAGEGGIIKYSKTSEINSYNGNRITGDVFDYSQVCYEYDKNGNLLDGSSGKIKQEAKMISFINDNNKKIIPAKIFLQDGIRRAVYDNYCYMSEERKIKYGVADESKLVVRDTSQNGAVKNVQIIEEKENIIHSHQGIGSGAGYIELDNGTFELIEE